MVVLLYLFVEEVAPAHKGLQFVETTCSLNNSQVRENISCDCGVYTKSACYPCLKVIIMFKTSKKHHPQSAFLHENLYFLDNKVCTFILRSLIEKYYNEFSASNILGSLLLKPSPVVSVLPRNATTTQRTAAIGCYMIRLLIIMAEVKSTMRLFFFAVFLSSSKMLP